MKKSVLMFSLLSGTALMFPRLTIASGFLPTHTGTPEPKPAFQFEQLDKAYKTAGVCFLGVGDCGGAGFGSMGGDDGYKVDTVQQCGNEGYSVTSCSLPLILPENVPITALILPNVSKTGRAPARKPALPKLPALPARSWRRLVRFDANYKKCNATLVPVTAIPMRRPRLRAMFPMGAA